jgi:hypothetical protein
MLPHHTSGGSLANALPGASNVEYKTAAGTSSALTAVGTPIYYSENDGSVNFVAYYPYRSDIVSGSYPVDVHSQSTLQAIKDIDLMIHNGVGTESTPTEDVTVPMTFTHKLAKLVINAKFVDGPTDDLLRAALRISRMPTYAACDLYSGTFSGLGGTGTTITPVIKSATSTQATWEALIIPHDTSYNGRSFTVMIDDNAFVFMLWGEYNIAFEAGKVYTYTFFLSHIPEFPTYLHDGMTNCYMVTPGQQVQFQVSRAYRHNGSSFTNTLHVGGDHTDEFVVEILWDDNNVIKTGGDAPFVSGAGNTAMVTVKTNNTKGNAVVAIKKKGYPGIVWSYHIWVTDYEPDNGGQTWTNPNGTYIFMNRNLGATENSLTPECIGLMYQYGRKDPFPSGIANAAGYDALYSYKGINLAGDPEQYYVDNQPETLEGWTAGIYQSIENPLTFYSGLDDHDGNWLPGRTTTLWNSEGDEKTLFDPCPPGWRVPIYVKRTYWEEDGWTNWPWAGYENTEYWGMQYHDESYAVLGTDINMRLPLTGSLRSDGSRQSGLDWEVNNMQWWYTRYWMSGGDNNIMWPEDYNRPMALSLRYINYDIIENDNMVTDASSLSIYYDQAMGLPVRCCRE